jgi:hypothetical protein
MTAVGDGPTPTRPDPAMGGVVWFFGPHIGSELVFRSNIDSGELRIAA